jgi:Luciferase-like monooxygenase
MDYGRPVKFGVFITPDATRPEHQLELAALADDLAFDLIGVQDHPYQRRFVDTWTLLTAMAMRTKKIHVFPDVANLPLRPPAILAKAAASLDLNAGADVPVEMFTSLTVEHGMDTYVIGGMDDPEALRWFASEVVPAVREAVAKAR